VKVARPETRIPDTDEKKLGHGTWPIVQQQSPGSAPIVTFLIPFIHSHFSHRVNGNAKKKGSKKLDIFKI
jgi:hypothetical protein